MKQLTFRKSLRMAMIIVNALILIIWSGIVWFWYMAITSDIPPAPTVKELLSEHKDIQLFNLFFKTNQTYMTLYGTTDGCNNYYFR